MMTEQGATDVPTREFVKALTFVGGAVGVSIGLLLWLFSALVACGCTTPPVMQIVNFSSTTATVDWQTDGLLGTPLLGSSGTAPIPACQAYTPSLEYGSFHRITIVSANEIWSLAFVASGGESGAGIVWVVIGPDGSIEQVASATIPAGPDCGT